MELNEEIEQAKENSKKFILKSKAFVLNSLVILGSLAADNLDWLKSSIPAKYAVLALVLIGVMNIALRYKGDNALTIKPNNKNNNDSTDNNTLK